MVAAFDYTLHGKGGAAPSIDTAMHGLVDAAHVDHLHPDSGIAIATAADGEELTAKIFGDKVVWVPWRRPGFQLGLDIAAIKAREPARRSAASSAATASPPGATRRDEAEANSLWIIDTAAAYIAEHGRPEPFGAALDGLRARSTRPSAARRRRRSPPTIRGLASTDRPQVGHFTDADVVLDFLAASEHPRLARARHQLPRPLPAHQGQAAGARPAGRRVDRGVDRAPAGAARGSTAPTTGVLRRARDAPTRPRSAAPTRRSCSIPGVGMFSYGANKQTARVAGEFYVNAINVMRGAEALSTYAPIDEAEKFRIEYWALEEAKLQRMPKPKPLATRIALVTGAASGIGKAIATRLAAEGACVVIADLDLAKAQAAAAELGGDGRRDRRAGRTSPTRTQVQAAIDAAVLAFGGLDLVVNNAGLSLSKSLLETTVADWDLQHNVMAKGSFLVSRAAARVLIDQKLGGDIIYISSKNSVFAGPNNIAYSATKADQAHQVRLLAAELGEHGVKVNGINPDGVVRGSGIFAGGWGAKRAAVYGVPEEELGAYYAQRTLLKREVLPENVANAVFVLCTDATSRTPPACTSPSTRASPRPSCDERGPCAVDGCEPGRGRRRRRPRRDERPGHARLRRPRTSCGSQPVARFPNGPVRTTGRAALEHRSSSTATSLAGLAHGAARGAASSRASASTRGPSTTRCSEAAACSASPFHYRDERTAAGVDGDARASCRPPSSTPRTACSTCRSTRVYQLAAEHGAPARLDRAPTRLLLIPDLIDLLAHRRARRRAHQRLDDGPARRRTPASGTTSCIARLGLPRGHLPRSSSTPGTRRRARCCPTVAARARRQRRRSRDAVGSHDTASAVVAVPATRPRRRLHLVRHLGARRRRARAPGAHARPAARPTSPTRAASTGACASCTT